MLHFFRQKGLTSAVYGAVIVATVLVFVINFNPSAGKRTAGVNEACAARVQGSCIEPKAHMAAYRLIFQRGAGRMGEATASRIVLEGLIERELLISEAGRLGLTVTDDEITDSIYKNWIYLSVPADNLQIQQGLGLGLGRIQGPFKDPKTKQFDMKMYEKTVKQFMGQKGFREWQGREILAEKMRDLVRAPVRIADEEALSRYVAERTTSTVDYVVVRRSWLEKYAIPTDQKSIDTWAKDTTNLAQVKVPVRHILVKGGEKAEEKDAAKKKAEGILERVKKGEDFSKLAKEFSEDPGSKDKGGMYPGEMVERFVEPFKKAVESVKPGELVQNLVETQFGWHIIKRDPASKEDIEKAYRQSKSLDLSKEVSQKIMADMKSGKSGDDAIKAAIEKYATVKPPPPKPEAAADGGASAKADGGAEAGAAPVMTATDDPERPQLLKSNAFNRGGSPIPAISGEASEAVINFAFSAKAGELAAEPIRSDDGFLVVSLREQKPATKEDFAKERDVYEQELLGRKQAEALAHYVRRLHDAAKAEIKVDENNVFGAKVDAGAGGSPVEEEDEGP